MNLLNKSSTKKFALSLAKEHRQGKFTRVSAQFLERIERKTAALVAQEVAQHPSVGKTLT
jgi:hypothetical protein